MAQKYKLKSLLLCHFLIIITIITEKSTVESAKVPAVIVFGDSSVDPGNNNEILTIARSNFPPYGRDLRGGGPTGRFSDGRLPTDFISQGLGLNPMVPAYLDPKCDISHFVRGVSFASAGSGYDNATSDVLSVIPLWKELEYYKEYQKRLREYLGNAKATHIISEALYLTSMGTNDFLENYFTLPGRRSQFTVDQYMDFLVGIAEDFLRKLYALGARKVSFGGLIPMGCLPLERATNILEGGECMEMYNIISKKFNAKLSKLVDKLNKELRGVKIVFSNPYDIFLKIIHRPRLYGFEVADRGCCGTGEMEMGYICNRQNPLTCSDGSKFVFWDAFHPSERTSLILAYNLLNHPLSEFR